LTITGRRHSLWRAVDQDGTVLDIRVQPRRDATAATRFFRKLLTKQCRLPRVLVTDTLRSSPVAQRAVMPSVEHRQSRYLNRAQNSHQPTRQCERAVKRCRTLGAAHRFLAVFSRDLPAFPAPPPSAHRRGLSHRDGRPLGHLDRHHQLVASRLNRAPRPHLNLPARYSHCPSNKLDKAPGWPARRSPTTCCARRHPARRSRRGPRRHPAPRPGEHPGPLGRPDPQTDAAPARPLAPTSSVESPVVQRHRLPDRANQSCLIGPTSPVHPAIEGPTRGTPKKKLVQASRSPTRHYIHTRPHPTRPKCTNERSKSPIQAHITCSELITSLIIGHARGLATSTCRTLRRSDGGEGAGGPPRRRPAREARIGLVPAVKVNR
jgi:DDE domain